MTRRRYELLVGTHGRFEDGGNRIYKAGTSNAVIELTNDEAAALGDRVRPLAAAEKAPPKPAEAKISRESLVEPIRESTKPTRTDEFGVADMHWKQATSFVGKFEDETDLLDVLAEEVSGRKRRPVIAAIHERAEALGFDLGD